MATTKKSTTTKAKTTNAKTTKAKTTKAARLQPSAMKNLDGYGSPALAWARARAGLEKTFKQQGTGKAGLGTHWLSTTDPDGMPHTVAVGAAWIDGTFYFTAGPGTRKARNLARDPRLNISLAAKDLDLVVEGTATRVTDAATLEKLAKSYRDDGWPVTVEKDAFTAPFSAPSAGPPPWYLYRVTIEQVFAVATAEPHGATRWRFDAS